MNRLRQLRAFIIRSLLCSPFAPPPSTFRFRRPAGRWRGAPQTTSSRKRIAFLLFSCSLFPPETRKKSERKRVGPGRRSADAGSGAGGPGLKAAPNPAPVDTHRPAMTPTRSKDTQRYSPRYSNRVAFHRPRSKLFAVALIANAKQIDGNLLYSSMP